MNTTNTRDPAIPGQTPVRLRVLHAAVECAPFATTGGLGDVLAALPGAQRELGMDARIILPRYGFLDRHLTDGKHIAEVDAAGRRARIIESSTTANGAPIYWCDIADLFGHCADPYRRADGQELEDLALRFAAFSEAVARFACQAGGFGPQVVHVHDWHAALVPAWLKQLGGNARSILSIHNLAFQGKFDAAMLQRCGLPAIAGDEVIAERNGSFLRAGIVFSDVTSTVSASYAREIQQAEHGFGLADLLATQAQQHRLTGIVNGIDERSWNPQTDASLPYNYGAADVDAGKHANRLALAGELQLDASVDPVVAFIGRLTSQKGADLIAEAGVELLSMRARYVLVGVGEAELTQRLQAFGALAPGRVAFCNRYDPPLVRRVLGAADLLLMPSRFEPCGMLQMYAQRYGAVPVVRATGGLIDTVVNATPATLAAGSASGVQFIDADARGLCDGVRRGLDLISNAAARQTLRACGMSQSFSWSSTAADYRRLYL